MTAHEQPNLFGSGATVRYMPATGDGDSPVWYLIAPDGPNVGLYRNPEHGQWGVSISTEDMPLDGETQRDHDRNSCPYIEVSINGTRVYNHERPKVETPLPRFKPGAVATVVSIDPHGLTGRDPHPEPELRGAQVTILGIPRVIDTDTAEEYDDIQPGQFVGPIAHPLWLYDTVVTSGPYTGQRYVLSEGELTPGSVPEDQLSRYRGALERIADMVDPAAHPGPGRLASIIRILGESGVRPPKYHHH